MVQDTFGLQFIHCALYRMKWRRWSSDTEKCTPRKYLISNDNRWTRQKPVDIRKFFIPALNFNAETYVDLIDWTWTWPLHRSYRRFQPMKYPTECMVATTIYYHLSRCHVIHKLLREASNWLPNHVKRFAGELLEMD